MIKQNETTKCAVCKKDIWAGLYRYGKVLCQRCAINNGVIVYKKYYGNNNFIYFTHVDLLKRCKTK